MGKWRRAGEARARARRSLATQAANTKAASRTDWHGGLRVPDWAGPGCGRDLAVCEARRGEAAKANTHLYAYILRRRLRCSARRPMEQAEEGRAGKEREGRIWRKRKVESNDVDCGSKEARCERRRRMMMKVTSTRKRKGVAATDVIYRMFEQRRRGAARTIPRMYCEKAPRNPFINVGTRDGQDNRPNRF